MMVWKVFPCYFMLCFVVASIPLASAEGRYLFEGYFQQPDGNDRTYCLSRFLPYNPVIYIRASGDAPLQCARRWPCGVILPGGKLTAPADLIWIEAGSDGLKALMENQQFLSHATVIYTTTHPFTFPNLRQFLENNGFSLMSHWYWEGEGGHALFVVQEIFDATLRSLNCSLETPSVPLQTIPQPDIAPFLHKALNKSPRHTMRGIDFIYMINLDTRPEKFSAASAELEPFEIYPYRFSAVNGWELPNRVKEQIGMKVVPDPDKPKYLGTVYWEDNGVEYRSTAFIDNSETTYFAFGMTPGAIGIVMSHLSVLQDAYDAGFRTIWVMEDDVKVIKDPRVIPELLEKLDRLDDSWDILFTDIDTKDKQGHYVPCRAMAKRPNYPLLPFASFLEKFYPVGQDFLRTGMRYGAYSMIIRRSGMEKILKFYQEYSIFLPYDMDFWLIPGIRMYTVNDDIVSTDPTALSDNGTRGYQKRE